MGIIHILFSSLSTTAQTYNGPVVTTTHSGYYPFRHSKWFGDTQANTDRKEAMRKEILIVDDAKTIRLLLRMTLEAEGYCVLEAGDAQEALLKLDGRRVDLIMTDLNMPNMDGISFAIEVKKRALYLRTPIIMITTESGAKRKGEGQAAGLNAWITKPFNGAQMLAAVNQLMAA